MECEICGAEIKGRAYSINIGTSKLKVCEACARYGVAVPDNSAASTTTTGMPVQKKRLYEQMDLEIEEEVEPVDYGRRVKAARERAGLKQEELAKMINEKQSLLRKIENEEMIPTEELRMKIERVLKPYFR